MNVRILDDLLDDHNSTNRSFLSPNPGRSTGTEGLTQLWFCRPHHVHAYNDGNADTKEGEL